jgi:hypothetical protein
LSIEQEETQRVANVRKFAFRRMEREKEERELTAGGVS